MSSARLSTSYSSQRNSAAYDDDRMSSVSEEVQVDDPDGSSYFSESASNRTPYNRQGSELYSHSRSRVSTDGEDFATGSMDYDYSSGYDPTYSNIYGDEDSLRSPGSSTELSSTFTSFYYDNETMRRARSMLNFIRQPMYFAFFATAGSGALGGLFRAAHTFTKQLVAMDEVVESTTTRNIQHVSAYPPAGYPNLPEWLQEVRASLPVVVEGPLTHFLHWRGVPILSELQKPAVVEQVTETVSSRVRTVVEQWRSSGPMLPPAVVLPLLSYLILRVAKRVVAKQGRGDDGASFVYRHDLDDGSTVVGPTSMPPPAGESQSVVVEEPTHEASETSPLGGDGSPGEARSTFSSISGRSYQLSGDVHAAVVGGPALAGANALIIASAKYGCQTIWLDEELRHQRSLLLPPPSLRIEFTNAGAVNSASSMAESRGCVVVSVFAQPVMDSMEGRVISAPLVEFEHPRDCFYLFVPADASGEEVEAAVAASSHVLHTGTTLADVSAPMNQCFVDRVAKERRG